MISESSLQSRQLGRSELNVGLAPRWLAEGVSGCLDQNAWGLGVEGVFGWSLEGLQGVRGSVEVPILNASSWDRMAWRYEDRHSSQLHNMEVTIEPSK